MPRGCFISIEGIEGAGKTTAKSCIAACLDKAGISFIATREPGGTAIAEKIRQILLLSHETEIIQAETELLLMFACRVQHLHTVILPALEAGQWVISDRFIDASYAYQGGGRKIAMSHINALDKWLVGACYPDLTLLLDVSPEVGFKRTAMRGLGKDRIEREKLDFFNRVRTVYLKRAKQNKTRIKIIDASHTLDIVSIDIAKAVNKLIKEKKNS